jgi:hypothetical protein
MSATAYGARPLPSRRRRRPARRAYDFSHLQNAILDPPPIEAAPARPNPQIQQMWSQAIGRALSGSPTPVKTASARLWEQAIERMGGADHDGP